MTLLSVSETAAMLLTCLCAELGDTIGGSPCRCCLSPGTFPPMDACCDGCEECEEDCAGGQAAVNVGQIYPSTAFPTPQLNLTRCDSVIWVAPFTLTVYRCAATVDDQGRPPTCEQVTHDALVAWDDAAAMRRAVVCCFGPGVSDWCDAEIVPGLWTPIDPQGGCHGGQMTVTIAVAPQLVEAS